MSQFRNKKAFTLIELIIVIAIVALIAAAVFVSVNPAQRLGDTKDSVRASDAIAIEKAIQKQIADLGAIPTALAGLTIDTPYMLVTEGGDDTGTAECATLDQPINRINAAADFKNYIGQIPVDPDSSGDDTGYYITRKGNSFYCEPCNAYGDEYAPIASVISGIYGPWPDDGYLDSFQGVYADGTYTYAVGYSYESNTEALIVKFNSDLSIASRKVYGGGSSEQFNGVASDGTYIYAVGYTYSEGVASNDALIVKFNSDLSIASRKVYGGASSDIFYEVYSDGTYIYAVGYTYSEGVASNDALIVKFNSDLSIASRKVYGGGSTDIFYEVYSDGTYIYAVGVTSSEGVNSQDALIVKFNSDLSIAARKVYGGASNEQFNDVSSDGTYIYAVGDTNSEGVASDDALIVKFNSDLSIASRKVFGSVAVERAYGVCLKDSSLYLVSGYNGNVTKLNSDLAVISEKQYITSNVDSVYAIYCDGTYAWYVGSIGVPAGWRNATIARIYSFPAGTSTSTPTDYTWQDTSLTFNDSTLTLADSTLTLADSTLTLADSTLTLADATIDYTTYIVE